MVPEITTNKTLTEREERFLEALFDEAKGDLVEAKRIAGYPNSTPTANIVKRLRAEIEEGVQLFLVYNAPKAVKTLVEIIMADTMVIDSANKIKAAKEILDRAGVVRTEKKEVSHTGGVVLLPPKRE